MKAPGWCLALVSLVAIAVAIYAGTFMGTSQIQSTTERIYRDLRLFDLEVRFKPTRQELLPDPTDIIGQVQGVSAATFRLRMTGTVDLAGDRVTGALVMAVSPQKQPEVGGVLLLRGGFLVPGQPERVIVDATFAEDMGVGIGDELTLRVNGRENRVKVGGIGVFPEFLMSSVDDNFSIPVRRTAGAFMISNELVAKNTALGLSEPLLPEGSKATYNTVAVRIAPGHPREAVRVALRSYLERAGVRWLADTWQENQYSVRCNKVRIASFQDFLPTVMSVLDGLVFLVMLLLAIRTTKSYQREIATLLALGVPGRTILLQWIVGINVLVVTGALLGTVGAFAIAGRLTRQYVEATGFPLLFADRSLGSLVRAWAVCLALVPLTVTWPVALLLSRRPARLFAERAGLKNVSWTLSLALRLDVALDRIGRFGPLGFPERIGLRNVVRRPLVFLTTTLCIAGMLVMASSMYVFADGIDASLAAYLSGQHWTYLVEFVRPKTEAEAGEMLTGAGATSWEGLRVTEAVLRHGGRELAFRLVAGNVPSRLRADTALVFGRALGRSIDPEVLVDLRTARLLDIHSGDELDVSRAGRVVSLRVVGVTGNFSVNEAFVSPETMASLLGREVVLHGALLTGPPSLARSLSRMTDVARLLPGERLADASTRNFRSLSGFIRLYGTLGVIVGALLVLVFMTMNIDDRTVEYALLRSHGFSTSEILRSILVEVLVIAVCAISVSYPLTKLATLVFQRRFMSISDFYPLRMSFSSWLLLMGPALAFTLLSVAPALWRAVKTPSAESLRARIAG